MHTTADIRELLTELDVRPACELESQVLDFKEWSARSLRDAVDLVVEMAVCMANGGGGTVVFGVHDRRVGQAEAIGGVPPEVDSNRLKQAVYDRTDPKLTPVFEELRVAEGTGRVLVMHVFGGLPPYTDSAGMGKVRVGTECKPLTGTLRRAIMVETGETDVTAVEVEGDPSSLVSPVAMERLRDIASRERAPDDLLRLSDLELLRSLDVLRANGRLTRAGLLIAGREEALAAHLPQHVWTHFRMRSDTEYDDPLHGRSALPVAIARLEERVATDNPVTTVVVGAFHLEYRTYPEIALREALVNAFTHRDYRLGAPVLVKQYRARLDIHSPGGFVGGVSPQNVLHHQPVARNPHLVEALIRLRLVNRGNLGVRRMFQSLLIEGKEPPTLTDAGEAVTVSFRASAHSAPFRAFAAEQAALGRELGVDHLLILHWLLRHPELRLDEAARLTQRPEEVVRETLAQMAGPWALLERGGGGRDLYWMLDPALHRRLEGDGLPERDRRIRWEAAKTRILSVLQDRARRGAPGLSNAEARGITHLGRSQVKRLLDELRREAGIRVEGGGAHARWTMRRASDSPP